MTFEDKATGSDSLSKRKTLIEGEKAPALHSLLLMCNRYICSIDEELSETDRRDQSPSIIVLNKPVEASNLPHSSNGSASGTANSEKRPVYLKGEHGAKGKN